MIVAITTTLLSMINVLPGSIESNAELSQIRMLVVLSNPTPNVSVVEVAPPTKTRTLPPSTDVVPNPPPQREPEPINTPTLVAVPTSPPVHQPEPVAILPPITPPTPTDTPIPEALSQHDSATLQVPTDEAYIFLLTNDSPMHLIWALEGSLRDVNATRRRIALCTPAVSDNATDTLRKLGMEVRNVPQPRHPNFKTLFAHWADTLAKLAIFDQTDLRQFVYLDADTMVNQNIDVLFSRNTTSMVYGMRDVIDCTNGNPHLNAGLLVSRPNATLKRELMAQLEDPNFHKVNKGDQEMLDVYLLKKYVCVSFGASFLLSTTD